MSDLKDKANRLFQKLPNATELFANEKGSFFTSRNLAENASKDKAKVQVFKREEAVKEVKTPSNEPKPLSKQNKAELLAEVAKREGLEVPEAAKNKELVELIEEFDAAATAGQETGETEEK